MRAQSKHQVIFGGNYFELPPSSCWLIWNKNNGVFSMADAELAWTNFPRAVRMIVHKWHGFMQEKGHKEKRYHRTQKPVRVLEWCLGFAPKAQTVLDPYVGSGSTLIACMRQGRRGTGIEREKDFCDTAVKRIQEEEAKRR